MRAGRLDRRITIQEQSTSFDDTGGQVMTWTDVATVWAEKVENNGQERFLSEQFIGKTARSFRIRWSETVKVVTTKHRVMFDGVDHDIVAVAELGRREGIRLDCTARSETQMDNA